MDSAGNLPLGAFYSKPVVSEDDATSRLFARFVRHDSSEENMKLLKSYLEKFGRVVGRAGHDLFHQAIKGGNADGCFAASNDVNHRLWGTSAAGTVSRICQGRFGKTAQCFQ